MRKGMAMLLGSLIFMVLPVWAEPAAVTASSFLLKSNNVTDQGTLPTDFTCDGKDISPELSWSNAPVKTASYALIVSDPDAPGGTFYHWVLYNISPMVNELTQGQKTLPLDTIAVKNSWNSTDYKGACPPKGSTHHYLFTLYALDTKLTLPADTDAKALLNAMQDHILSKAELTVQYGHL